MRTPEFLAPGLQSYTIEVTRTDRRTRSGTRRVYVADYACKPENFDQLQRDQARSWPAPEHSITWRLTYELRTNLLSGAEYWERYDEARVNSPSSEAFWSF